MVRELGSHCTAALYAGDAPLFALADGTVHCGDGRSARAHSVLLAAAPSADRGSLLTTGEDGRVCRTGACGTPVEIAAVPRKWVECVASSALGQVAYSSGRSVWLHGDNGTPTELRHSRSVAGMQFSPDGTRIAVARYGGITLHDLAGDAPPAELEWKGIYAALTFSPDGRFLLAFMQDEVMHGWRLPEGAQGEARHFRMTGYPSRIRDWSWSGDGRWLVTSGAPSAIAWPFDDADGPMGKSAIELGSQRGDALVSAVACHPSRAEVAIGYADGALAVASPVSPAERLVRAGGRGAVTCVSWHNGGSRLAFGSGTGECGVLDVPH